MLGGYCTRVRLCFYFQTARNTIVRFTVTETNTTIDQTTVTFVTGGIAVYLRLTERQRPVHNDMTQQSMPVSPLYGGYVAIWSFSTAASPSITVGLSSAFSGGALRRQCRRRHLPCRQPESLLTWGSSYHL